MTDLAQVAAGAPVAPPQADDPARPRFLRSLAGRLLALTVSVMLIGEAVFLPAALANFHENWLRDRINLAQTAALALEAAPDNAVTASLRNELLVNAEVRRITLRRSGERVLFLTEREDPTDPVIYDYTRADDAVRLGWAMQTFLAPPGRELKIVAHPRFESGELIEVELNEAPLKRAMNAFALRTIVAATLVAAIVGAIVYSVLSIVFVRPMRRLTESIERFRDRPEDASIPFTRTARTDEIGRAERAAADMADEIRANLRQRERLAALGGAVARIAHDLRNMLATAELVTERLSASDDPKVRQIAPRLERAISRAADLASSTARFGRADEEPPVLRPVKIADAVAEAAQDALAGYGQVSVEDRTDAAMIALADMDQLHRILVNLMRNAAQAIAERGDACIRLHTARRGDSCVVCIEDNGPGVPDEVKARLFEPFAASDGHGAGLGLAIARELARAQGGDVTLARSDKQGARFEVLLPAA
jgi:signal transduction histidine kinase